MNKQMITQAEDVKNVLKTFNLLDKKTKDLALIILTGIGLVSEAERKYKQIKSNT